MRVRLIQKTVYISHPFVVRILNHFPCAFIGLLAEVVSHELLCQINNLEQSLLTVLSKAF